MKTKIDQTWVINENIDTEKAAEGVDKKILAYNKDLPRFPPKFYMVSQ